MRVRCVCGERTHLREWEGEDEEEAEGEAEGRIDWHPRGRVHLREAERKDTDLPSRDDDTSGRAEQSVEEAEGGDRTCEKAREGVRRSEVV